MAETASGFGTVRVNSEELKAKAEDAYMKINQYQETLEQMSSAVTASSAYWTGRGGDMFREVLKNQMSIIEGILEAYKEYPKELLEYAGIYSEVISQTESLAESVKDFNMF